MSVRRQREALNSTRGRGRGGGQRGRGRGKSQSGITGSSARGRRGQGRGKSRNGVVSDPHSSSSSEESDQEGTITDDGTVCPQCGQADDTLWIQCDNQACEVWYRVKCTSIDSEEYDNLGAITWFYNDCTFNH